jgi:hypothetical protein
MGAGARKAQAESAVSSYYHHVALPFYDDARAIISGTPRKVR